MALDRDPIRLAWKRAPLLHVAVIAAGLAAVPLLLLAFDLPRQLANAFAGFGAGAPAQTFLGIVWNPPYWLRDGTIRLLPGWELGPFAYAQATLALALVLVLARAALLWPLDILQDKASVRAVDALVEACAGALVHARLLPQGAQELMQRAIDAALRLRPFLGDALAVPLLAGGRIVVALAYLAWLDPWLGMAGALLALVLVLLARQRSGASQAGQRAGSAALVALRQETGELVRRWLTARAHGATQGELTRFGTALRASTQPLHAPAVRDRLSMRLVEALGLAGTFAAPAAVGLVSLAGGLGIGAAASAVLAVASLSGPATLLAAWRAGLAQAHADLRIVADAHALLRVSADDGANDAAPHAGAPLLCLEDLLIDIPGSQRRIGPLGLVVEGPGTIALSGDDAATLSQIARVLAGLADARGGAVRIAGVDPARLAPPARAALVGFVAAEPMLLRGSWRENLTYGLPEPERAEDRFADILDIASLHAPLRQAGLAAPVDPVRHARLAAAIVPLRAVVQAALRTQGTDPDYIDPFVPDAYNRHATLGENILFGQAVGSTFSAANLGQQPFLKAVLEAENLTATLQEMGLSIARTAVELLDGIPDDNPLVARLGLFPASERPLLEEIVARQGTRARGQARAAERDRLVGLSLRYSEARHRLGLMDETLEKRILDARATFARLLPASLRSSVDFYDPGRLCRAASLADNLLFGRVAWDLAGAQEAADAAIAGALEGADLTADVLALGLATPFDPGLVDDLPDLPVAIDLARALLRSPRLLVSEADLGSRLPAVRAAMGAGVTVALVPGGADGFDRVLRVENGRATLAKADAS